MYLLTLLALLLFLLLSKQFAFKIEEQEAVFIQKKEAEEMLVLAKREADALQKQMHDLQAQVREAEAGKATVEIENRRQSEDISLLKQQVIGKRGEIDN